MVKRKRNSRKGDSQSSSSSNLSSIEFIPDCILTEILGRLPLKSVTRFMCVSKNWLALISDPSFARYFESHPNTRWTFLSRVVEDQGMLEHGNSNNLHLVDAHKTPTLSKISVVPFKRLQSSRASIVAFSNGLLLIKELRLNAYSSVGSLRIFNPVSLQVVKLPHLPQKSIYNCASGCGEGFITRVNSLGVVASYKVVRPLSESYEARLRRFQVFSSDKGEWHTFYVSFTQRTSFSSSHRPIVYNGILHWINVDNNSVIAYDPYARPEHGRLIPLPSGNIWWMCFDIVGGRLGCVLMDNYLVDLSNISDWSWKIWTLKDYDNAEWSLDYNFSSTSLDDVYSDAYLISLKALVISEPQFVHPLNPDIIFFRGWGSCTIVSYNIRTHKLEVVNRSPQDTEESYGWNYALPFIIPSCPTVIPRSSRRSKKKVKKVIKYGQLP